MQLTPQGSTLFAAFCQYMQDLKKQETLDLFINPTFELFTSSIPLEVKDRLKQEWVKSDDSLDNKSYHEAMLDVRKVQEKYLRECIDHIHVFIHSIVQIKNNCSLVFNKIILFIKSAQLSVFTLDLMLLENINPAIKIRFTFFLINKLSQLLMHFKTHENFIEITENDYALLERLQNTILIVIDQQQKYTQLSQFFHNELHIREGSIIASGQLPRFEQLIDIFTVYHAVYFAPQDPLMQSNTAYYNMVVKTFDHLGEATKVLCSPKFSGMVNINVKPINQEISIRNNPTGGTLVRRSQFGVQISYEDNTISAENIPGSPEFKNEYTIKPYRLKPELKIAYLTHIEKLDHELKSNPKHEHSLRRAQKLCALKQIVSADDEGDLSPAIFTKAKDKKSYLFVAYGNNYTKTLIESAETDMQTKMWQKLADEKSAIGRYGYSISDSDLVKKIIVKHASYSLNHQYDINIPVNEFFEPSQDRDNNSGWNLWDYDKKIALEIILLYHAKQLLHPALFNLLENKFPMMYARSFSFFRKSEVESLVQEVKNNILELCWADTANNDHYIQQGGLLCQK